MLVSLFFVSFGILFWFLYLAVMVATSPSLQIAPTSTPSSARIAKYNSLTPPGTQRTKMERGETTSQQKWRQTFWTTAAAAAATASASASASKLDVYKANGASNNQSSHFQYQTTVSESHMRHSLGNLLDNSDIDLAKLSLLNSALTRKKSFQPQDDLGSVMAIEQQSERAQEEGKPAANRLDLRSSDMKPLLATIRLFTKSPLSPHAQKLLSPLPLGKSPRKNFRNSFEEFQTLEVERHRQIDAEIKKFVEEETVATDPELKLKKLSIWEELQEFRDADLKIAMLPEYIGTEEREIVREIAERMRFGYQYGEKSIAILKLGGYEKPVNANFRREMGEDVFVNVSELAQHGREGFIAKLRLRRLDSGSGIRRNMLWDVAQHSSTGSAKPVAEGDGGVYAFQSSSGQKLAMFKPTEEEKFVREGLYPGEGAVREEAAYVLDSRMNGFSGVPPTAVARLHLSNIGKEKQGAVQRFMASNIGSMDGFGMPFDLEKAKAFVPVGQVHRIGLLDVRLFNTDRHPGNILLLGEKAPYTMVPIDHGCILPSWFHLSEARFDWLEYPQCKVEFSSNALEHIESLDPEKDAIALRKLGIREECVTTLKICTLLLKTAAKAGKNLFWIGSFMQRSGCFENPSELEKVIAKACECIQLPFSFEPNEFQELKGKIALGVLSRRPPRVFYECMEKLLQEAVATCVFESE